MRAAFSLGKTGEYDIAGFKNTETSMSQTNGNHTPRRHLYGRRKGRPLSPAQTKLLAEALHTVRLGLNTPPPRTLGALFPHAPADVWLEIGFGGGEHLLFQAEHHREIGIIGCEPFISGVAKALQGMEASNLGNVRIYDDDAAHVLQWLPEGAISRAFILFPDPWPKKRHRKRRFLTSDGLGLIARVLQPGAELRFATDIPDYAEMVLAAVDRSGHLACRPGRLESRPDDWPLTRYAEKAKLAGRACQFFIFTRI